MSSGRILADAVLYYGTQFGVVFPENSETLARNGGTNSGLEAMAVLHWDNETYAELDPIVSYPAFWKWGGCQK